MYKNIIVAVDGSPIADNAAKHAIELAKQLGAELTAVTVTESYEAAVLTSLAMVDPAEYRKLCKEHASDILLKATQMAEAAGVSCAAVHIDNQRPYKGIIKAAEEYGADLIVMGSHGRRGLEALLLGSQTTRLLTYTKVPTLVIR